MSATTTTNQFKSEFGENFSKVMCPIGNTTTFVSHAHEKIHQLLVCVLVSETEDMH